MKKRLIPAVLAVCLLAGSFSVTAFAEDLTAEEAIGGVTDQQLLPEDVAEPEQVSEAETIAAKAVDEADVVKEPSIETLPSENDQETVALQEEVTGEAEQADPEDAGVVYETGVYDVDGVLQYFQDGKFAAVTGVVNRADNGKAVYVENGLFQESTGVAKRLSDNQWVYIDKGSFKKSTGVAKRLTDQTWVYVEKGIFKKSTGIAKRLTDSKWVYIEKGVFQKSTGVAKRLTDKKWVFVKKGVFQKSTGAAKRLTDKKWVFVKKGVFQKSTGAAKQLAGSKTWIYVKKGVFQKHTGVARKLSGDKTWIYVLKGKETTKIKKIVLTAADKKAGNMQHFIEAYAKAVVANETKPSMSEARKLRVLFDYTLKHFKSTNNPRIPHYTAKDWVYVYANDMFGTRGGGNCMSFAAAFAFLAKAAGCKNVYAINSGGHGWTEVNGLAYDPEQYHDTNRKIYATKYSDPLIKGYKAAITNKSAGPYTRVKIKAF